MIEWMGLLLALAVVAGVAYRWAGSRLFGVEADTRIDGFVWVRKGAPAVVVVALCLFVVFGFARCS